jgi:hypothetical protein
MPELMQAVEAARKAQALSEEEPPGPSCGAPPQKPHAPALPKPRTLWVDKYAPRSFMDLLSAEPINRQGGMGCANVFLLHAVRACFFPRACHSPKALQMYHRASPRIHPPCPTAGM